MAFLAVNGNVQPDVYEEMLYRDTGPLVRHVERLTELREQAELERTKALIRATGARIS